MRRPWRNTVRRMAHGDPRPARTPSSQRAAIVFFRFFFTRQLYKILPTSLIFVELVEELYTLHGERPPAIFNCQARASYVAALQPRSCQITREDGAIIDICMVVSGSIALFSLHARGSTPQTAGALVCAHEYRAVRTVQTAQPL